MVMLRRIYDYIVIFTFLSLFATDAGSMIFRPLGKLGTGLWLFSYLFVFIFALKSIVTILGNGLSFLRNRSVSGWITPFVLLIWFYIVIVNIPLPKNVSYESTQQINQTLNFFTNADDLGFHKPCFLGYPARQFFIPALPSVLWGRNIVALNTGGGLYFLLGLLIFASGVLANFKDKAKGDIFCGILLSLLFHAYYVNYQLFYFEQSIFPFSLGLIACGVVLHFWVNPSWEIAGLLGFSLLYLIFSYTPSLALFGLSIPILLYLAFKVPLSPIKRRFLLLIGMVCLISFCISLKIRSDIVISRPANPTTWAEIQTKTLNTTEHLLFQTQGKPIVSPIFNFVFLFGLFTSLFFIYGWEMSVLAVWILATMFISVISRGWAAPPPDFALHRANVVFPVFLAMGIKILQSTHTEIKNRSLLILFLFIFLSGISYQALFLKTNGFDLRLRHVELATWAGGKLPIPSSGGSVHFYLDPSLRDQYLYWNSNDCLQYFIPNCTAALVPANPGELLQRHPARNDFLLIPIKKIGSPLYRPFQGRMKYAGSFKFRNDEPLEVWVLR